MAAPVNPVDIQPRQVANKSKKKALIDALRMTLDVQSPAVRRNTQTFNRNRYTAVARIADYDAMKDRARRTKENAIANLPALLQQLEASVLANGGHFFLAKTAADANNYIRDVLMKHEVKLVVKGKSITSEETRLNHALEAVGITVAESDLAEFILQVADEQPSHIIAPALHYSRERITALFKRKFQTDLPLDTGEELTRFAREILRQQFIGADAGISGANLIAADSGTLMLVESEGNIRMTTTLPPVHIAIAGIEKVVPSRTDFQSFIELLPASATGQPLTSYVSILRPPLPAPPFAAPGKTVKPREFHMVLIDNGRSTMREDPVLHEALYCIRCSACLNVCANFETVGGHAFGGETYSGGIGGAWEAGTGKLMNARFSELVYRMLALHSAVPDSHRHSVAQPEPTPAHEPGRRCFSAEVAVRQPDRQRAPRPGRAVAETVLRQLSQVRQVGNGLCIAGQQFEPRSWSAQAHGRRAWRRSPSRVAGLPRENLGAAVPRRASRFQGRGDRTRNRHAGRHVHQLRYARAGNGIGASSPRDWS